jgi:hypothetical protein
VAVVSVKLSQPQFEGQTKGKLNSDIAGTVQAFVNERLGMFLEQNPPVARKSSTRPSKPAAPAKPHVKPATSLAAKAHWMAAVSPENLPTAPNAIPIAANSTSSRVRAQAVLPSRAAIDASRPSCR